MKLRAPILLLIRSTSGWAQNCPISQPNLADRPRGPVQWFGTGKLRVYLSGREWAHLPLGDAPTIEEMLGPDAASLLRKIPAWKGGFRNKVVWNWDGYDPHADPTPPLRITGRRLDASAPPLLSDTNRAGYNGNGSWTANSTFIMSGVLLPTDGCWQITGKLPDRELSFVVLVKP